MHVVRILIKRESVLHRLVVHASDARDRAPQRLCGARPWAAGENDEGEQCRRKTETNHGNISTTQRGKRKRDG